MPWTGNRENRDIVREVIAGQEREWQEAGRVTFYE